MTYTIRWFILHRSHRSTHHGCTSTSTSIQQADLWQSCRWSWLLLPQHWCIHVGTTRCREVNYSHEEAAVILERNRRNRFRDWISSVDSSSEDPSRQVQQPWSTKAAIPQKSEGSWHLHASVLARVETKYQFQNHSDDGCGGVAAIMLQQEFRDSVVKKIKNLKFYTTFLRLCWNCS